ncbi:MAG: hypothetical protein DWQ34_05040 [Planctomycetota bacterium]|nr:MAG: hypothetical protein DWQ34_05040 [Planctomycetota bacterium]REK29242.1 MAG: hypothetical protein DWQ41_04640 [Planctomycetota bacterium]REK29426.1 MAG: hypothetical protein DWQ45_22930 [Planctomycetota bacterium]
MILTVRIFAWCTDFACSKFLVIDIRLAETEWQDQSGRGGESATLVVGVGRVGSFVNISA